MGRWIMDTFSPAATRFSAVSRPMKPPPTMAALFAPFSLTMAIMASMSGMVHSWNIFGESTPGRSGRTGEEPVEMTSAS